MIWNGLNIDTNVIQHQFGWYPNFILSKEKKRIVLHTILFLHIEKQNIHLNEVINIYTRLQNEIKRKERRGEGGGEESFH